LAEIEEALTDIATSMAAWRVRNSYGAIHRLRNWRAMRKAKRT
jgi:hypothetical protein